MRFKKGLSFSLLIALLLMVITACSFLPSSGDSEDEDLAAKVNAYLTSTAEFKTAVAAAVEDQAPVEEEKEEPTEAPTETQPPADTATLAPTFTPADTATPTIPPTVENPWVLQQWCLEHTGCVKVQVRNKTNDWAQITLTYLETGESKFFTVRPGTRAYITLKPGKYAYIFNFCSGEYYSEGQHTLNNNWYIEAQCSY